MYRGWAFKLTLVNLSILHWRIHLGVVGIRHGDWPVNRLKYIYAVCMIYWSYPVWAGQFGQFNAINGKLLMSREKYINLDMGITRDSVTSNLVTSNLINRERIAYTIWLLINELSGNGCHIYEIWSKSNHVAGTALDNK